MTVSFDSSSGISYRGSTETSIHNLVNTTSCTLYAPLASALTLSKGTGNPTWSRATTAWGFNELGYLEGLASGCAFFGGTRLVRNTVRTTSEDFSNAAWTKSAVTVFGTNIIVCSNATSQQYLSQSLTGTSIVEGQTRLFYVRVKKVIGGADFIQLSPASSGFGSGQYVNLSLIDGSVNAVGCTAIVIPVPGETNAYDFYMKATATVTGAFDGFNIAFVSSLASARLPNFTGDGSKSYQLLRAGSCDVTGYASSYVPEYVSVGVVSSPFFGAGIDGAKYYDTDWQGAPIPAENKKGVRLEAAATNNVLASHKFISPWITSTAGSELLVNGTFDDSSNWTVTGADGTHIATFAGGTLRYQSDTSTPTLKISQPSVLTLGKTYVVTTVCSTYVSGTIKTDSAAGDFVLVSAPGTSTKLFVATQTAFSILRNSTNVDATIDSISVKEGAIQIGDATGLDGIANSASSLTWTTANAVWKQSITMASAARCTSAYLKLGTPFVGPLSISQDDGATWTDVTSQINSSSFTRVEITSTVTNPVICFKSGTAGDIVIVDCVQNEAGTVATSPIVTTTAAVTRNADSLTYQTASNWSDTAGTAVIEVQPYVWSVGGLVGSATNGLLESGSNSGATSYDGTNAANGPTGTPSGRKKLAMSWGNSEMTVASDGIVGTPGTYDGAMGLSSIGIGVGSVGYFGPITIYDFAMNAAELKVITA